MKSLLKHVGTEREKNILPKISTKVPPIFTPGQIDIKSLTMMFGELTKGAKIHSDSSTDVSKDVHPSSKRHPVKKVPEAAQTKAAKDNEPSQASPGDTLRSGSDNAIPDTHLSQLISKQSQSQIFVGYNYPLIACAGSDQAWVQVGKRKLQLVDRHGSVKDTVDTNFHFNDMVTAQQGDLLLSDSDNNCIKLVLVSHYKTVRTLFKTQVGRFKSVQLLTPSGLCFLQSGDIAVSFPIEGQVIIFSMSGKVIKELNKKLFKYPFWVAQSKVNSDLYITDKTENFHTNTGKVVALDKDYRVRYEYTGQHDRESIDPSGLCTDNAGCILITDQRNCRVDIIDKDGMFLQYLLTGKQGLLGPWSIDVDRKGGAWVGECCGRVIVVKYLQ